MNFNGSEIAAYGVGQDLNSTFEIQNSGQDLALSGNAWKRIDFAYDITANTVLEFEFKLTAEGEIHGIGFDVDTVQNVTDILQLGGTDPWARTIRPLGLAVGAPLEIGKWYKYTVFVGNYFSGPKNYLTFINDHDVANPTAASVFRNLRVFEARVDAASLPAFDFRTATITGYGDQDRASQLAVLDGGETLKLSGNGWKKLAFDYNITEDTVLAFEFKSDRQGEVHGIGFDHDNRLSSNLAFQLAGSQTWGRQDFRSNTPTGDWQRYEISVGEFFTGNMAYLTLINDHDRPPSDSKSFFRNLRVFERGEPVTVEETFDLGNLAGVSSQTGGLNATNQSDRYRFSLDRTRDLGIILEGLSADANLSLFDGAGTLLAIAATPGQQTELLSQTLAAGNYELLVETTNRNGATDYDLIFSATADVAGQNRDLQVSTATYLGGTAQDEAAAIEISVRNELVVAGNFGNFQGVTAAQAAGRSFLGATSRSAGQIVRLSQSGREVLSVTRLGNDINDMDVNRVTGAIAAGGDFGVTVLNPTADQVYWSRNLGAAVRRVAIANNGTVVTLHDKTISVWNPGGTLRAQQTLIRSYVNDIAIDPTSGKIYVTGFDNKRNANDSNNPVQVAFLTSLDSNLNVNWQTWGFEGNSLTSPVNGKNQNDMADTRGYRVTLGRDGELYFLGEVAGGNSIFRWNGKDRSTATQVKYDAYNDPYNSASPHQAYYARINPDTGEVMQGQLAFPRHNGAANAFRVDQGSIAADENGNVYIGGATFSGVDQRDNNAIAGQLVGSYAFRREGDLTALVVSNDFQQRRLWTPFTDNAGKGKVQGFAVGQGRAAILGTVVEGTVITESALNPTAFNANTSALSDVYLATWATDSLTGFASVQYGTAAADVLTGGATADLIVGGLGADILRGDPLSSQGRLGGADVFAYNSAAEGGDTILDFKANDSIRISAAGFGLVPGSVAVLAASSQALGSRAGFVYSGGLLSFDADGAGSQASVVLATLARTPSLLASQIQIV